MIYITYIYNNIYTSENPLNLSKRNAFGKVPASHTGMVVVSKGIVFMTTAKVQIHIDAWLPGSGVAAIDQVAIQGVAYLHAVGVIVAIAIRAVHARRALRVGWPTGYPYYTIRGLAKWTGQSQIC